MKRRICGLVCTLALLFAVIAPAGAAAFSDVKGHWAEETIYEIAELGLVNGYPNGTFQPNGYITNAEAASVYYKLIFYGQPAEGLYAFVDVPETFWAYPAIASAGHYMFMYEGNYFYPNERAVREDVGYTLGYYLNSVFDVVPYGISDFSDYDAIFYQIQPYVDIAVQEGLISGYPNGTFAPYGEITRAEFATLVLRLHNYISMGEG